MGRGVRYEGRGGEGKRRINRNLKDNVNEERHIIVY